MRDVASYTATVLPCTTHSRSNLMFTQTKHPTTSLHPLVLLRKNSVNGIREGTQIKRCRTSELILHPYPYGHCVQLSFGRSTSEGEKNTTEAEAHTTREAPRPWRHSDRRGPGAANSGATPSCASPHNAHPCVRQSRESQGSP